MVHIEWFNDHISRPVDVFMKAELLHIRVNENSNYLKRDYFYEVTKHVISIRNSEYFSPTSNVSVEILQFT